MHSYPTGAVIIYQSQSLTQEELKSSPVHTAANPTTCPTLSVRLKNLLKNLIGIWSLLCQAKVAAGKNSLKNWYVICSCLTNLFSDLGKSTITVRKPLNSVLPWHLTVTGINPIISNYVGLKFYISFSETWVSVCV